VDVRDRLHRVGPDRRCRSLGGFRSGEVAARVASGIGGLGDSPYGLLAGIRALCLGFAHDAKEPSDWLATPIAVLRLIGLVGVLVFAFRRFRARA
jgi:hypothetical protein